MRTTRARSVRGPGRLGIGLLILGLVPTPLPTPDFHNVRHHDAPGETCPHHDHLLLWHPGVGATDDVAVLHWHWFLPTAPGSGAPADDDSGPALHAHVAGWQVVVPDDGPRIAAGPSPRELVRPPVSDASPILLAFGPPAAATPAVDPRRPRAFGATLARAGDLAPMLQRWTC